MDFAVGNAYYIKLGRGGAWEEECINRGLLRFDWNNQAIADINEKRWELIREQLRTEHEGKLHVASNDLNRLQELASSDKDDVWITFHAGKLYWTRLADSQVEQDETSKFRRTSQPWSDQPTNRVGKLYESILPGRIAQLRGFRGTACRVSEKDLLCRVLTGAQGELSKSIAQQREELCRHLEAAIKQLHWKDFEILVDLVFRDAGWVRDSLLGEQVKGYDLSLREPITGSRYLVQVKSRAASLKDFNLEEFSPVDFRRLFLVVHSPSAELSEAELPEHVELLDPAHLAALALSAGLTEWLEAKVA